MTFLLLEQWQDPLAITALRASNTILLEALLLIHDNFFTDHNSFGLKLGGDFKCTWQYQQLHINPGTTIHTHIEWKVFIQVQCTYIHWKI